MDNKFPTDGSWFALESIDRTVYRWAKYKPDGARQMGKPGRWQKQVWSGDYMRWENCDVPQGVLCEDLTTQGPITAAWEALSEPKASVRLWSEQSPEPVPMLGGSAVATYWHLEVEGVQIKSEATSFAWQHSETKRHLYTTYEYAPRHLRELFEELSEAFQPKEK